MIGPSNESLADLPLGGTLIHDYTICPRQVWLGAHAISPDEDDSNLVIGRFLHDRAASHSHFRTVVGHSRFDAAVNRDGDLVVLEIKKSTRTLYAARMQLAFYLLELNRHGVHARGEIRIPEERRKIPVELTPELVAEVEQTEEAVRALVAEPLPPQARRIPWCSRCAYRDFCWS